MKSSGFIPILGADIRKCGPKDRESKHGAAIVIQYEKFGKVRFVMIAPSELDREEWVECIQYYQKRSKTSKDTDKTFKKALDLSKNKRGRGTIQEVREKEESFVQKKKNDEELQKE